MRVDQIRFQLTDKRYGNVKEKHVSRYLLQLLAAITTGDWLTPALDLPTIVNIHHVVTLKHLCFFVDAVPRKKPGGRKYVLPTANR